MSQNPLRRIPRGNLRTPAARGVKLGVDAGGPFDKLGVDATECVKFDALGDLRARRSRPARLGDLGRSRRREPVRRGRKEAKQLLPQFYVLVRDREISYVCDTHTHTHNNTTVGRIGVEIQVLLEQGVGSLFTQLLPMG